MPVRKMNSLDLSLTLHAINNAINAPRGNITQGEILDAVNSLYTKVNSGQMEPLSLRSTIQIVRQISEMDKSGSLKNSPKPIVNSMIRAIGLILLDRAITQLLSNSANPILLTNRLVVVLNQRPKATRLQQPAVVTSPSAPIMGIPILPITATTTTAQNDVVAPFGGPVVTTPKELEVTLPKGNIIAPPGGPVIDEGLPPPAAPAA